MLAVLAAIWPAGCLAPAVVVTAVVPVAHAGTTAFIGGQLLKAYKVPLDSMTEATRAAIVSLELSPAVERPGSDSFYFMARELCGREVSIRLEAATPRVTRVQVRVGVWGDRALSDLVMRELESHLLPAFP